MKSLKILLAILQFILGIIALLGIYITIEKILDPVETVGDPILYFAYITQLIGFVMSFWISRILSIRNFISKKNILYYVPILYFLAFLLLLISHQFGLIEGYYESMGKG